MTGKSQQLLLMTRTDTTKYERHAHINFYNNQNGDKRHFDVLPLRNAFQQTKPPINTIDDIKRRNKNVMIWLSTFVFIMTTLIIFSTHQRIKFLSTKDCKFISSPKISTTSSTSPSSSSPTSPSSSLSNKMSKMESIDSIRFNCYDQLLPHPFSKYVLFGVPSYLGDHYLTFLMKSSWGRLVEEGNFIVYSESDESLLHPLIQLKHPFPHREIVLPMEQGESEGKVDLSIFNTKCVWKTFPMFKDMYERYPNMKWYIKADSDTFVNVNKLLFILQHYDHNKEYIASGIWGGPRSPRPLFKDEQDKLKSSFDIQWPSGALYAVSHGLMKQMHDQMMNQTVCPLYEWEDFNFALCARNLANNLQFVDFLAFAHQKKTKEQLSMEDVFIHNVKPKYSKELFASNIEEAIEYLYSFYYHHHSPITHP